MQSTTPPTIYSFHLLHCQIYIKRQILNCKCDASPKQDVTMRAPSESCPSAAQKPNLTSWMMGGDSVPTCCPVWGGMLLGRAEGDGSTVWPAASGWGHARSLTPCRGLTVSNTILNISCEKEGFSCFYLELYGAVLWLQSLQLWNRMDINNYC